MTATPETFRFHVECHAWEKAGDDVPLRIGGIASTDELDADDERLVQEGLDFDPFLTSGWFNDNHGQKTSDVLGFGTGAKLVKPGDALPSGKKATRKGWWVEGHLVNTNEGRKVWNLARSLEETPRKLGFSIEGNVVERDKKNPKLVKRAEVRNVAITHCPKNTGTELRTLAKALMAGAGSSQSFESHAGGDPGDGAPLAPVSLEADLIVTPRKRKNDEEDPDGDLVAKGDTTNDFDVAFESDPAYLETWAESLPAAVRETVAASRVSKSEAMVFLASRRPDLSLNDLERIVAHAEHA